MSPVCSPLKLQVRVVPWPSLLYSQLPSCQTSSLPAYPRCGPSLNTPSPPTHTTSWLLLILHVSQTGLQRMALIITIRLVCRQLGHQGLSRTCLCLSHLGTWSKVTINVWVSGLHDMLPWMWSFLPLLGYTRSRDPEEAPFPCPHSDNSHVALTAQPDQGSQVEAYAKQGPGGPQFTASWTRRGPCWSPVPKADAPVSLSPPGSLFLHR